jgi:hypothetical protein
MTERIEDQIERFAPGFRDLVLRRKVTTPAALERYNPNYVGGDIAGGAHGGFQLFARPPDAQPLLDARRGHLPVLVVDAARRRRARNVRIPRGGGRAPHRLSPPVRRRADPAPPLGLLDLEPSRHAVGQLADVGDDADDPAIAAEVLDRIDDRLERLGSSVPNPSSRNRLSSDACWVTARLDTCSASARARASEARNVSPPDRVRTLRVSSPFHRSTTRNSSPW